MSGTRYVIALEGNGQMAAYESKEVAEVEARRLSARAGACFIVVPQRADHIPALLAACETALENLRPVYPSEHIVIRRLTSALTAAKGEVR